LLDEPESSDNLPEEAVRSLKGSWIEAGGTNGLELALSRESMVILRPGDDSRKGSNVKGFRSVMAGGARASCAMVAAGW